MNFNEVLVLEYLNLFYTIEEDTLLFNGYETYASKELKHLRRQFGLGDKSVEILRDWCTLMGMSESGWILSTVKLDVDYIWAPYVPLIETPQVEFAPNNNIQSRYATRVINPDVYGVINVGNL